MITEGMNIADRYEIIEKIGAGGMSDVYKAMDNLLGRNVAIKVLKNEYSEDVNFLTKFRTEAQSAASLENPNIVSIYDVGNENKMHYIVMEYVEGITLKTYIEKKERIGYKEAISIAIQTCNGIRAAHNKNIIHRDIKPQNIIISTEGKVKVTDFGIARAATSNTINSDVMGSVHYTSPEQARNGYVDAKSDIYSLGIVMYEMVTGRVPFNGDSAVAVALQHLQEEIIRPSAFTPDLPISLEKIILKCTQKSPDRRYASVDELIADLKKALINPDEDFVVLESVPLREATRVITEQEVEQIQQGARKHEELRNDPPYKERDEHRKAVPVEEEDDEDDEAPLMNPKMEKAVTIMGIVAAIFMLVVVVLILGTVLDWFHFGKSGKDEDKQTEEETNKVEMIDVRGKTFEEAQKLLNEQNLGIQLEGTESSEEYEEGQIIRQSVEPGEMVDKNTTVKVVICAGKKGFALPDVKGKDEAEATGTLQADPNNLVVSVSYKYDATVKAGQVISTTPEAGATVHAGDTITVYVSRGSEETEVPNVEGKTENEAKSALRAAGFNVSVSKKHDDSVAEGKVISQSVKDKAAPGSTIKIVVSLGAETTYYSYSAVINEADDVEKGGANYHVQSASIKITAGGATVYSTQTSSFPKQISVNGLTESSGTLKIVWTYVNDEDDGDSYTEVETSSITFKK
ncbi:MAG: Stk1 family PASTA domain-containing Ser/Thr kinase [Lachnospiraceae bacterium]|jgi:serine/threonine-protein kinase|nr:Stk1 family PASTA domain-containing Ser/Thr kinase [Lachnospiraceae bacterium]